MTRPHHTILNLPDTSLVKHLAIKVGVLAFGQEQQLEQRQATWQGTEAPANAQIQWLAAHAGDKHREVVDQEAAALLRHRAPGTRAQALVAHVEDS